MPTRADFEAAAVKFDAAAAQVSQLTVAAQGAGAATILQGGALGRTVPQRIEESARVAHACRLDIEQAAETCRERAMMIAEYELQLQAYDASVGHYRTAITRWSLQYDAWWLDDTGYVTHPGYQPVHPTPPPAPPAWADVRRP